MGDYEWYIDVYSAWDKNNISKCPSSIHCISTLQPQAVLFGRWEVGGVGVRGSITYRHTKPGPSGLVSLYVMLPLTPTSHFPNNTACDYNQRIHYISLDSIRSPLDNSISTSTRKKETPSTTRENKTSLPVFYLKNFLWNGSWYELYE